MYSRPRDSVPKRSAAAPHMHGTATSPTAGSWAPVDEESAPRQAVQIAIQGIVAQETDKSLRKPPVRTVLT